MQGRIMQGERYTQFEKMNACKIRYSYFFRLCNPERHYTVNHYVKICYVLLRCANKNLLTRMGRHNQKRPEDKRELVGISFRLTKSGFGYGLCIRYNIDLKLHISTVFVEKLHTNAYYPLFKGVIRICSSQITTLGLTARETAFLGPAELSST